MHISIPTALMTAGILMGVAPVQAATGEITEYRNAKVWDGHRMTERILAVRDGRFVKPVRHGQASRVVDLAGQFVVPAYGNAHEHITNPTPAGSWTYIEEGVFYVWNPNSIVLGEKARNFFRSPETIDVALSMGGITEPGGHPETLYTGVLSRYVYKGMTLKDFVGNAFHYGATKQEIEAALHRLAEQKADFVKAYLVFSEQYARRRSSKAFEGERGLNPANMPYLVRQASKRGMPTYAHVESRFDLVTAAKSGAAFAGHLPAYRAVDEAADLAAMTLSEADARLIARSGLKVIPTYGLAWESYTKAAKEPGFNPAQRDRVFAVQAANMRALSKAGAVFLTGTDRNPAIFDEIEHWVAIGGMSKRHALKVALSTGKHLFPKRRIGCFEAGCEADFLVLSADPTADLSALRRMVRIVKAGKEMSAPPAKTD